MASHWEVLAAGTIRVSNTPQELWEQACEYFKWCDDNPIIVKRTITSGKEAGKKVELERVTPYSTKALCLHCGIEEEYLKDLRNLAQHNEFKRVADTIIYIIYCQNYEMAVVGEYNAIFTAKVLNIDKDEAPKKSIRIEIVNGLPELSKSEEEVLEKLELEKRDFGKGESKNATEQSEEDNIG